MKSKRLHRLFQSALRILRSIVRAWPFTALGHFLFLAALGLYFYYGRAQSDFVFHSVSFLIFGLEILALAAVFLGLLYLRYVARHLTFEGDPEEARTLDAGSHQDLGLRLPSFRFIPIIDYRLRWRSPDRVQVTLQRTESGRLREQVRFLERGRFSQIERYIEVSDIFGLVTTGFSFTRPASLCVQPAPVLAEAFCDLRQTSGEGFSHPLGNPTGDRVEMRRYCDGDPLRFVIWKAYARTRRLLVRTPERALNPEPSAIGCFVAGEGDEPSASTARMLLSSELYGENFVFLATGAQQPAENPRDALRDLIDSVQHREHGALDLHSLTASLPEHRLENCVIFVPERLGHWLEPLRAFVARLRRPPLLLLTTDQSPEKPLHQSRWQRLMKSSPSKSLEILKTYDALKTMGVHVRLLHLPTGRWLTPQDLEAWR